MKRNGTLKECKIKSSGNWKSTIRVLTIFQLDSQMAENKKILQLNLTSSLQKTKIHRYLLTFRNQGTRIMRHFIWLTNLIQLFSWDTKLTYFSFRIPQKKYLPIFCPESKSPSLEPNKKRNKTADILFHHNLWYPFQFCF